MAEQPRARSSSEEMFLGGEGEDEAGDGSLEKCREETFPFSPWNNRRDRLGLVSD